MKLEAKQRLRLTAASPRDFAVEFWTLFPSLLAEAGKAAVRFSSVPTGEYYPSVAYLKTDSDHKHDLQFSSIVFDAKKKTFSGRLSVGVDFSNEIHRAGPDSKSLKDAVAVVKKAVAILKKCGFKAKVNPATEPIPGKIHAPSVSWSVVKPDSANTKPAAGPLYFVKVAGPHGSRTLNYNPIDGSRGPWEKTDAMFALQDLQKEMAYDDEFKRGTFSLVPA
jgi:hypothetical protein